MRVVVVGAGLGGLSAAAHLSNRGHDITIVERDATPGGRAGMVIADGFRLDNGPTVLTMPNLLADAFNAAGADMADFVTIKPVDPMYRAVYADGSTLFVRHGREAMTEEIRRFANGREAAGLRSLLRLVGAALPGGDGVVHRRQLRLTARPAEAVAGRRSTWSSSAASATWARRWRRSSTTNASSGSSVSSRCTPASPRTRRSPSTP